MAASSRDPRKHACSNVASATCGLMVRKCNTPTFPMCRLITFSAIQINPHIPAAGSQCPMAVLAAVTSEINFVKIDCEAPISTGSPSGVPVPCISSVCEVCN